MQSLATKAAASWQAIAATAMSESALVLALQAWEKLVHIYPKTELPYDEGIMIQLLQ